MPMQTKLYQIIENVILSRALYVCCDLNIADILQDSPMDITELSNKTQCEQSALARLMRVLVMNDFFVLDNNKYSITALGETLSKDHANSLRPLFLHDDETRWNALGNLGYCIKTGRPSFDQLYNEDYFSCLSKNKELSERFNQAMHIISNTEEDIIAKEVEFNGIIADIGGGTGQLINKVLDKHSSSVKHSYLFDLPEVPAEFDFDNCEKISGSFFDSFNITADVYILKRIIHDWDDDKAVQVLKNVVATMPNDAKLLIFEGVIDDSENSKFLSTIDLLLLSIIGGKERTYQEFEDILKAADLKIDNYSKLTSTLSLLECVKV